MEKRGSGTMPAPSYTFTSITEPGGNGASVSAVNDRGEVAGDYSDSSGEHGFVDDNGTFTTLNVPGATSTSVSAINDRGEVVGYYVDSSGTEHGFVATPHGGETAFATFGELRQLGPVLTERLQSLLQFLIHRGNLLW
jgi:uncharacterized membrane protein